MLNHASQNWIHRIGYLIMLVWLLWVSIVYAQVTALSGAQNPITPSLVAARSSGVAPLAVHFDASGTYGGATSFPFHELQYTWDFGDSGAGSWSYGNANVLKNKAFGPIAGHVYANAGTYTVTLSVTNGTSTQTATATITVTDPDTVFSGTNTICFSTTADFTGCPAGATQTTQSNWVTIGASATAGRRILLHKGQTFTSSGTGPQVAGAVGSVGAFGSGANPIIQATSSDTGAGILRAGTGTDWRFSDITIDPNGFNVRALDISSGAEQILFQRISGTGVTSGFTASFANNAIGGDQIFLIDNTFSAFNNASFNGVFVNGITRFVLLGNNLDDASSGQHICRLQFVQKSVASNNSLSRAALTKAVFLFHSNESAATAGTYAQLNIVSDNLISAGVAGGTISVNPTSTSFYEPLYDIIVENNFITDGANTGSGNIQVEAQRVTIRNNIFNSTNRTGDSYGIALQWLGVSPQPDYLWIYNNTQRSPNSTAIVAGVSLSLASGNLPLGPNSIIIKNNLVYGPSGNASSKMISNSNANNVFTQSNNTSDAQVRATDPNWTDGSGLFNVATDYQLGGGSYAINSGTTVPVYIDALGAARTGTYDIGAVQHP